MQLPSVLVMASACALGPASVYQALFFAPATYKKQGLGTRLVLYVPGIGNGAREPWTCAHFRRDTRIAANLHIGSGSLSILIVVCRQEVQYKMQQGILGPQLKLLSRAFALN